MEIFTSGKILLHSIYRECVYIYIRTQLPYVMLEYYTSTDIDECALGQGHCDPSVICMNTIGSFECECLPGFTGDGVTCEGQYHVSVCFKL